MKSLIDELKKTGIGVIGTILVGGFLTLEVLGLNSFENFTYRFNCGERIKYYYKQEPQNFCEDSWALNDAEKQLQELMQKNCAQELKRFNQGHKNKHEGQTPHYHFQMSRAGNVIINYALITILERLLGFLI